MAPDDDPLFNGDELLQSFELLRDNVPLLERALTGDGVEWELRLPTEVLLEFLPVKIDPVVPWTDVVDSLGSSAGGAATATFTRASKADVFPVACWGRKAIMDLREGLEDLSLFCLEYATGGITLAPLEPPRPVELLSDILASVEPDLGICRVEDLGRSVGADRVLFLNAAVLISVSRTLALEPAGLSNVGASLLVELLPPPLYLLGGRPRGARTGDITGCFPEPAFRERFGETTAAAAAIKDSPEVPCRSMLLTS